MGLQAGVVPIYWGTKNFESSWSPGKNSVIYFNQFSCTLPLPSSLLSFYSVLSFSILSPSYTLCLGCLVVADDVIFLGEKSGERVGRVHKEDEGGRVAGVI